MINSRSLIASRRSKKEITRVNVVFFGQELILFPLHIQNKYIYIEDNIKQEKTRYATHIKSKNLLVLTR